MKKMSETIVFFGSGPVAAKSLELLADTFTIEAIVTKPRPLHHRGSVPVLEVAQKLKLPIVEASKKKELSEKIARTSFTSSIAVLVDFGIIVEQSVIDKFSLGIVNSHFSLLPEWRGADPITFAILSGQKRTGVSLMLLVEQMDEGPVLAFGIQELSDSTTTPELTDRLIHLSHGLLKAELPRYLHGESKPVSQEQLSSMLENYPKEPTYSRKLTKEDGTLDWSKPAAQLEREIRAFLEWPKSRTMLAGKDVIVTKAYAISSRLPEAKSGEVEIVKEDGAIAVATSNGTLCIERLKPAGKQEMSAKEFIAGYGNRL
jgi:methionyl-tRNA formyltransferase